MKNLRIIGYYTTPRHGFRLASPLLDLIEKKVYNEILAKYTFPNVKSKVLEIMLDTEVKTNTLKIKQLSKTGRGQFISFGFWLPYHTIVKNKKVNIPVFINEFMEALREALLQYKLIPDELIDKLKEQLISETEDKKEYVYVESEQDKQLRKIVDEVMEEYRAGEI